MKKGSKMTSEQRERVSLGHKGVIRGMLGKKHSRESNEKNRQAHLGKTPWNKGKRYSDPKISERMSKTQKKLWANPEHREKMSRAHLGFKVREETKIKLRKINIGKIMSPEAILKSVNKRREISGYMHTEEAKIKIGLASKGRPSWNKGINFPTLDSERNEWQLKVAEASKNRLLKLYESGKFPQQTNTKPERQIKEELIKRGYKEGIDFIHQYKFMNKFMCDFCFPKEKIIVEVYGDFWHANPTKYPKGRALHLHQIKGKRIDKAKEAYISKADNRTWTYIIIWENDINKNITECVDRIVKIVADKSNL